MFDNKRYRDGSYTHNNKVDTSVTGATLPHDFFFITISKNYICDLFSANVRRNRHNMSGKTFSIYILSNTLFEYQLNLYVNVMLSIKLKIIIQ